MLTQDLIDKIRHQIITLYQQAEHIDQTNGQIRSERFKYREFFNQRLFRCDSTVLMDYVQETEQNFTALLRLARSQVAQLNERGEQLSAQITAITQAIRANEVALKEHRYQMASNKKRFGHYKKAASQVMANSHQLHQELAQNHEFERRLNEMIFERQSHMHQCQLNHCDPKQALLLQQEILTLHQRLGRCRKAISAVEERIQFADAKRR